MTVRLAQAIGMDAVAAYAERFNVTDHLPRTLAMALGSNETTLLRLTTAYAMLVNGGKKITPTLNDRVQNRNGRTVYRHDRRQCEDCRVEAWNNQSSEERSVGKECGGTGRTRCSPGTLKTQKKTT